MFGLAQHNKKRLRQADTSRVYTGQTMSGDREGKETKRTHDPRAEPEDPGQIPRFDSALVLPEPLDESPTSTVAVTARSQTRAPLSLGRPPANAAAPADHEFPSSRKMIIAARNGVDDATHSALMLRLSEAEDRLARQGAQQEADAETLGKMIAELSKRDRRIKQAEAKLRTLGERAHEIEARANRAEKALEAAELQYAEAIGDIESLQEKLKAVQSGLSGPDSEETFDRISMIEILEEDEPRERTSLTEMTSLSAQLRQERQAREQNADALERARVEAERLRTQLVEGQRRGGGERAALEGELSSLGEAILATIDQLRTTSAACLQRAVEARGAAEALGAAALAPALAAAAKQLEDSRTHLAPTEAEARKLMTRFGSMQALQSQLNDLRNQALDDAGELRAEMGALHRALARAVVAPPRMS